MTLDAEVAAQFHEILRRIWGASPGRESCAARLRGVGRCGRNYTEVMSRIPAQRPSLLAVLVSQHEDLEEKMAALQQEEEPTAGEIAAVRRQYREWYSAAKRALSGEALMKLNEQHEGTIFTPGITKFLDDPRKLNVLKADDGTYPLGRWQFPFDGVRGRLERQRQLLVDAEPEESSAEATATELAAVLRRIPAFLKVLNRRRPESTLAGEIKDERDLQVVVEALLRSLFDDVRPEDYVSSKGGGNSRVDFVLPEVGIVVETKMTRASLTAAKLGEELLIDAGRYPNHPDCSAIVAYVYDPDERIENPRGLERDLTLRTSSGLSFLCVIS